MKKTFWKGRWTSLSRPRWTCKPLPLMDTALEELLLSELQSTIVALTKLLLLIHGLGLSVKMTFQRTTWVDRKECISWTLSFSRKCTIQMLTMIWKTWESSGELRSKPVICTRRLTSWRITVMAIWSMEPCLTRCLFECSASSERCHGMAKLLDKNVFSIHKCNYRSSAKMTRRTRV